MVAAQQRVTDVQCALDRRREAPDVDAVHQAAETVSNLITGRGVDLYADTDGGLLPGQDGEMSQGLPLSRCAGPALLGGS